MDFLLLLAFWMLGFTVGWAGRDWVMKSVEREKKDGDTRGNQEEA
jgi:hypothetical protein